jgi:hypothetical protein
MSFDEAERQLAAQRALWAAGRVSAEQFSASASGLRVEDASGRWWQLDPVSGQWLAWDGAAWRTCAKPAGSQLQAAPVTAGSAPTAQPAPASHRVLRRLWDLLAIVVACGVSRTWYWYSGMAETRADLNTCVAIVAIPVIAILFRRFLDRMLAPLQPALGRIPRGVRLIGGLCLPLVISNYLYAAGSTQFDYMFKTTVLSAVVSFVILRVPEQRYLRPKLPPRRPA